MENLNAEQVKKALECCHSCNEADCKNCGYRQKAEGVEDLYISCTNVLIADALALITSQEQRIKELTEQLDAMRGAAEAWKEHSKTLKGENEKLKALVDDGFDTENALNEKVKELTEENDKLYRLVDDKIQENKRLTEENERLKAQKYYIHSDGRIEMIPTVESVRADTVRKMQERLKAHLEKPEFPWDSFTVAEEVIDQIAKEMLEGVCENTTN